MLLYQPGKCRTESGIVIGGNLIPYRIETIVDKRPVLCGAADKRGVNVDANRATGRSEGSGSSEPSNRGSSFDQPVSATRKCPCLSANWRNLPVVFGPCVQ